jgi:endoglucanase
MSITRRLIVSTGFILFVTLFSLLVTLAPITSARADNTTLNVWWPTSGAHLSGSQPFKAIVQGLAIENYQMYWQVDGGSLNLMYNSYTDYPHKEASVDVTSWHWQTSGNYTVTFVAKNSSGATIAQQQVPIVVNAPAQSSTPAPSTTVVLAAAAASVSSAPTQTTQVASSVKFYVNPNSSAATQASAWRSSRPSDAAMMDTLAAQSQAQWLGNWESDVKGDVQKTMTAALAQNAEPEFVLYNIPQRDCGSYSAGGTTASAYTSWVTSVAQGIGSNKAVVILEPDALADISCLSSTDQQTRLSLLSSAVDILKNNTKASVYIDAGHSGWIDAATMAANLQKANVAHADGFSLNVSNYQATNDEINYGTSLSSKINNKHFVVDTSRNGNGSDGTWCNPSGRAIGNKPTSITGNPLVDAYLWVKTPGESDGTCNGGPSAGSWWADYALGLIKNAH